MLPFDRSAPCRRGAPDGADGLHSLLRSLPGRNTGRRGLPGDALNLVFVALEHSLRGALGEAGWTEVPLGLAASLRQGAADLARGRKLTRFPPFNRYRLEGRGQDMNWAQAVRPIAERHHFRLWRLAASDGQGRPLWWGCASYDLRVRWRDLSHVPGPDIDEERDHVGRTMAGSRWLEDARLERLPQVPREGVNDKGYGFRSDGSALVLTLLHAPSS